MGRKYILMALALLALLIAVLPFFRNEEVRDQKGEAFEGVATCARCHKAIVDSYVQTDHYRDSREADAHTVKGKFVRDSDYVMFNYDPSNIVVMHKRFGSLYQTHYLNNEKKESREFDIAIGSGRKGQSYLYWDQKRLFELPVSYYTPEDQWVVSPGYSSQHVDFKRTVTPRCLECHTTYAQFTEDTLQHTAQFGKNQMIYGITCEKCHGPGGRHVEFQEANPAEKTARYIVRFKQLSRDLQMDACGMCHAGAMKNILPAFTFRPGEALSKYYEFKERKDSTADVHGNQVQLLSSSKCYKMGDGMSCSTCHDVHANHRGDLAFYAGKCITCHSDYKALHQTDVRFADQVLLEKCIDCHMPNFPSKVMNMNSDLFARTKPVLIRSHLIKIYQGKSNAILGGQ